MRSSRLLALLAAGFALAAMTATTPGLAQASPRSARIVPGPASPSRAAPKSGATLAQAPAGLRAALETSGATASPDTSRGRAQLTASDGGSGDELGYSVAISGSTALVSAPGNDGV